MIETMAPCPFCGSPGRTIVLDVDTDRPRREYGCPCLPVWTSRPEDWNRRKPGPTTAKMLAKIAWFLDHFGEAGDLEVPIKREMAAAFMAEHEPAPPAVAREPLPREVLEYLDGQT